MARGLIGFTRREATPILYAIGRAAYYAQGLETELLAAVLQIDEHKFQDDQIAYIQDHPAYKLSGGELFSELRKRLKLTETQIATISTGLTVRNEFVHHLWSEKRSSAFVTASGRAWLEQDILLIGAQIWKAVEEVHELRQSLGAEQIARCALGKGRQAAIDKREVLMHLR